LKNIWPFFLLYLFVSCSGEVKRTEIPRQIDSTYTKDSASSVSKEDTTDEKEYWQNWECKLIKFPAFDSSLYLSAPFNGIKALHLLFPGNLYEYAKGEYFCEWKSIKGKSGKRYKNDFGEPEYFPYKNGNETRVIDTIFYTLSGREYILISFSTREFSLDEIGTGRYSGAFLGLALFEKHEHRWNLAAFDPAVTFNGRYQEADSPELVKISSTEVAYPSVSINGGPGDPASGSLELILRENKGFSIKVIVPYVSWINDRYTGWHYTVSYTSNENLFVVLQGDYSINNFKDWDKEFIPDHIEEMSKYKDSTAFTYTYQYKRDSADTFTFMKQYYKFK